MVTGLPIELPPARLHAELGRRRHRVLTVPAGLLLFVCLFLPAVDGCGSGAVSPIDIPAFWHPHLYGGVVAIAALARNHSGIRYATRLLRAGAIAVIAGGLVLLQANPTIGPVQIGLGLVLAGAIRTQGHDERRLAITGVIVAVLSLLWFGLWAGSAGALVGVYVSLAAAIFLLAGSLLWLSEI